MQYQEILAFIIYFLSIGVVSYLSYQKNQTASGFMIGDRSLNYWLTALAAHASDMSGWLFMGYPGVILVGGMVNVWIGFGLVFFMYLNWTLVAPKIRMLSEKLNTVTFSSFFESKLADTTGLIRVFTSLIALFFYTVYISAGLVALGMLCENIFLINYHMGVTIGILLVIPYVLVGGYRTLAWIDLFQGLFLMLVILAVPLYAIYTLGGIDPILKTIQAKQLSLSLLPSTTPLSLLEIFFLFCGMGLGYFGQPHIITKFMGIKHVAEMNKSKRVGLSWMILSLAAATLVGLVGIAYFPLGLAEPEQVFIHMVKDLFSPFLVGFMLCGVLAATINAMSSQVLVLSTCIAEDFYKKIFRKDASSKELLLVSRMGVIVSACVAYAIAIITTTNIFELVQYAWSGLGASFGPLLIFCLYSKRVNRYGAWSGLFTGAIVTGIWPYFDELFSINVPSLIPGFFASCLAIYLVSSLTNPKKNQYPNV